MSRDDDPIPPEFFTPPDTIKVTDRALALAASFQDSVPSGWIAAFSWYDGRRERASKDAPWTDQGPGLGLGAHRIGDIPEAALHRAGSQAFAVLIKQDIVDMHPERTIDLNDSGNVVFK